MPEHPAKMISRPELLHRRKEESLENVIPEEVGIGKATRVYSPESFIA
jgi:hypothetical protein